MKHLFIVNPAAGAKDSTEAVSAAVARVFSGRPEKFEIYTTTAPMDACDKIRAEAARGEELRVYACGGDGTLNECVCGAAGLEHVALTHFPTGTGNDFIKTFGEDSARFRELAELVDGEVHPLDVIDCNGRASLNICSVGIDARVGTDVHKYSSLPFLGGKMAYLTSTAVNFCKGIRQPMRVKCNGRLYYGDINLICCCNGTHYGGSFHPVPDARPDDGILNILVIQGVSRPTFVRLIGDYAKGNYAAHPDLITALQSDRIEIESDKEIVVNVDGEAIYGKRICMQLRRGALRFFAPRGLSYFRSDAAEPAET